MEAAKGFPPSGLWIYVLHYTNCDTIPYFVMRDQSRGLTFRASFRASFRDVGYAGFRLGIGLVFPVCGVGRVFRSTCALRLRT